MYLKVDGHDMSMTSLRKIRAYKEFVQKCTIDIPFSPTSDQTNDNSADKIGRVLSFVKKSADKTCRGIFIPRQKSADFIVRLTAA